MFDFDFSGIIPGNKCHFSPVNNSSITRQLNRYEGEKKYDYIHLTNVYPSLDDSVFLLFFDLHRLFLGSILRKKHDIRFLYKIGYIKRYI